MISLAVAWLLATGGATVILLAAMFAPETRKCKRKRRVKNTNCRSRRPARREQPRRACKTITREPEEEEEEADEGESEGEEEESEQEE